MPRVAQPENKRVTLASLGRIADRRPTRAFEGKITHSITIASRHIESGEENIPQVLHHSLTPVAVIPDVPNRCTARPRCIVVGVDLTDHAAAALRWAAQQARTTGAELVALHSWQVGASSLRGLGRLEKTRQGQQVQHEQRAQRWVERVLGPSGANDLRLTVEHGAPLDHLLAWADQADVLVLPAPGHHAVPRLLTGSTSGQLAHLGLCPVVVVPTANAATPAADRAPDRRRPSR